MYDREVKPKTSKQFISTCLYLFLCISIVFTPTLEVNAFDLQSILKAVNDLLASFSSSQPAQVINSIDPVKFSKFASYV